MTTAPMPRLAQTYLLCHNLPTLIWLGQLGTLEFHAWHSNVGEVVDGTAYTASLRNGKAVSFWVKNVLEALSLRSYVKTSGRTGLNVFVPSKCTQTFEQASSVCELIGRHVMAQHPDVVIMDWNLAKRAGKIFFDHNMNVHGKTLNVAYSPPAVAGAPTSMPLSWENLTGSYPPDFRIEKAEVVLAERGDVWSDIHAARQNIERVPESSWLRIRTC